MTQAPLTDSTTSPCPTSLDSTNRAGSAGKTESFLSEVLRRQLEAGTAIHARGRWAVDEPVVAGRSRDPVRCARLPDRPGGRRSHQRAAGFLVPGLLSREIELVAADASGDIGSTVAYETPRRRSTALRRAGHAAGDPRPPTTGRHLADRAPAWRCGAPRAIEGVRAVGGDQQPIGRPSKRG